MKKELMLLASLFSVQVLAADVASFEQQAKQQTQGFGQQLQVVLKQGLESGGALHAIELCNTQAPAIAANASTQGWTVGRTSLKTRNPDNRPDEWELETLLQFEQRKKAGEDPMMLTASRSENGEYRFMKAIPTAEMCLACHGSELTSEVSQKLAQLYPEDQAIGFKVGDLRGAFTLTKKVNE